MTSSHAITEHALQAAFGAATAAKGQDADIKAISAIVPHIIMQGQACKAFFLAATPSENRAEWMAETLALFGTKGLTHKQRAMMIDETYKPRHKLSAAQVSQLSSISDRTGRMGFSFPIWRFVAQGFGDDKKALLEHFGMQRQTRDNDVRDASLPFSDPQRDELGAGYFWNYGRTSIEYRRSYIACSIHNPMSPVTIVIRNSSYFYGRDRLPEAAYVSFGYKTPQQLKNLTLDDLTGEKSNFVPLQDMMNAPAIPSTQSRLNNIKLALDTLDAFDNTLSTWMTTKGPLQKDQKFPDIIAGTAKQGGLHHLVDFMDEAMTKARAKGADSAPIYMARIDKNRPAWAPEAPAQVNDVLLYILKLQLEGKNGQLGHDNHAHLKNKKRVLLSGPHGDFPLGPKYSKQLAHSAKPK